ncbi:hypothetical protein [Streptomyces sp. NPDC090080]|uniref:hypothetical protein n=1 Tax=Streptomyces sp. NPDC090080 TaxID=3365939 RepID=UPI0038172737
MRLIGRTAFVPHASWIDALCALAILLGCVLLCTCWYLDLRWPLCAVCLYGVLILQNLELDQQELHQHGRTEHVRVQQIGWSEGDGMDPAARRYTVTVDPRGDAPLGRGARPGPPVIQRLLQLPGYADQDTAIDLVRYRFFGRDHTRLETVASVSGGILVARRTPRHSIADDGSLPGPNDGPSS